MNIYIWVIRTMPKKREEKKTRQKSNSNVPIHSATHSLAHTMARKCVYEYVCVLFRIRFFFSFSLSSVELSFTVVRAHTYIDTHVLM